VFTIFTSLRGKIIAAVGLLTLVALLLLSLTSTMTSRKYAMTSLKSQTTALTMARAEGVADWVKARHQVVKSIAPVVAEAEPSKFLQQAKMPAVWTRPT
jgi:hypothetical protein